MNTQNNESNCNLNLNQAYEYTKGMLETKAKSLDNLDSRMGMFLGFGGVLLKFGLDAPTELICEQWIKSLFICLTILSVSLNAIGLLSKPTGSAVKPRKLMTDEYYNKENARVKAFIINSWVESEEALDTLGYTKSKYLNSAIILLTLAVLALGSISLITIFCK
ncbi:hypothetical protein [Anabaena sp. AL93]|uniref:hypothetical protein n=1 Tax=Anabaena sp. AL93 TaxID=1678133 RepID=UPI0007FFA596|nr:hypothetical protein [Anabaena sp. AL93]OBQ22619.1 MAG: hypothetical protein AN486_01720 [Anabaena sp. AL93]